MEYVESLVAAAARGMVGHNADAAEKVTRQGIEALQEGPVAFGLFLDAVKQEDRGAANAVGNEVHRILERLDLAPPPAPPPAPPQRNQQQRGQQQRGRRQAETALESRFEYFRRLATSREGEQPAQAVMRIAWAVQVIELALSYARYYAKGRSIPAAGAAGSVAGSAGTGAAQQ